MDDRLLFLQCIAKMMKDQGIVCSFDHYTPPLDQAFWDSLAVCQQTDDQRLLENIALLERAGYSTVPRHDFG